LTFGLVRLGGEIGRGARLCPNYEAGQTTKANHGPQTGKKRLPLGDLVESETFVDLAGGVEKEKKKLGEVREGIGAG